MPWGTRSNKTTPKKFVFESIWEELHIFDDGGLLVYDAAIFIRSKDGN